MFQKDQEITHEAVTKKLVEIISVRGKKGTKRGDQVGSSLHLAVQVETLRVPNYMSNFCLVL